MSQARKFDLARSPDDQITSDGSITVMMRGDQPWREQVSTLYGEATQDLSNQEAEQALLGSILINNRCFEAVADIVSSEHFSLDVHGRIFAASTHLINKGSVASPVTMKSIFQDDASLQDLNGAQYLVKLAASVVSLHSVQDFAREIVDLYRRRQLLHVAACMMFDCIDLHAVDRTSNDIISDVGLALDDIASVGKTGGDLVPISTGFEAAVAHAVQARRGDPAARGIMTGLTKLDDLLGGLQAGDLMIVGARPAMGKTALAIAIATNVASRGEPVAFFSLEMTHEQLASRMLASATGISSDRQRKGWISLEEESTLATAGTELRDMPLHVDDTPASQVMEIRRRAIKMRRKFGLSLIVVDYLQLITPGNTHRNRQTNRTNEVTEISGGLKALAKELGCPVIALSQLSRNVEQREDKRPSLADLRESGSIEQDADQIAFLFRDEYYLAKAKPIQRLDESDAKHAERLASWRDRMETAEGRMDVLVRKNRHGAEGEAAQHFDGATGRVTEFEQLELQGEF